MEIYAHAHSQPPVRFARPERTMCVTLMLDFQLGAAVARLDIAFPLTAINGEEDPRSAAVSLACSAMGAGLGELKRDTEKKAAEKAEKEKANKQKVMFENLFIGFKKKYDEEIKNASKVEQEEEDKRKQKI